MSLQKTLSTPDTPSAAATMAVPPEQWSLQDFWRYVERAKAQTEALAEQKMQALADMPVEAMREVCTQYRFFTIDYIGDLALLLARLPFGGLRSLLSQILAEELGEGDADKAHPAIYDRFLLSIGVQPEQLERRVAANKVIMGELTAELSTRSAAYGAGLRGMGGECLCQTYLAVMFEHLRKHPWIREHEAGIDWDFWTIHAGEADIVHGELTRQAIADYLQQEPGALAELAEGYERSITAWNRFWQNIFDECVPAARPRTVA